MKNDWQIYIWVQEILQTLSTALKTDNKVKG